MNIIAAEENSGLAGSMRLRLSAGAADRLLGAGLFRIRLVGANKHSLYPQ
jgi:hypothetical protein